jgi:hypothetical protein
MYPSCGIEKRKRPEAQPYTLCLVCYSVVLLGREMGSLQLLAPLLLTGGKGADLVIRGNVVLNMVITTVRCCNVWKLVLLLDPRLLFFFILLIIY